MGPISLGVDLGMCGVVMYPPAYTVYIKKGGMAMMQSSMVAQDDVLSARKEVMDFVRAAETLLSPALLHPGLTQAECDLIAEYVRNLSQAKNPWSRALPIKYA